MTTRTAKMKALQGFSSPRVRLLHALTDQYEASCKKVAEAFRPMYLAELETFAETVRPRFEAGELYGYRGDDDHAGEKRLETAIEVYFGLTVTQGGEPFYVGDEHAARAIIGLSPAADLIGRDELAEYNHPAYAARECIVWDVLAIDRARNWYRPTRDEAPKFDPSWARRAA